MKKIVLFFVFSLSIAYSFAQKGANSVSIGPSLSHSFQKSTKTLWGSELAYERGINEYIGLRAGLGYQYAQLDLLKDSGLPFTNIVKFRYLNFMPELRCYPLGANKVFYLGFIPKILWIHTLFTTNYDTLNATFFGLAANTGYRLDFKSKYFLQLNAGVGFYSDNGEFIAKESAYYTGNIMLGYKF